jgi:hypothetical protein
MPKTVKRRKNKLAGRYRNRWPDEAEISGRMIPKWVADSCRNRWPDHPEICICESVYLQMAKNANCQTPIWELLAAPEKSGAIAWLAVKRFDYVMTQTGAGRLHMHSACGLLDADFRTPSLDYLDLIIAQKINFVHFVRRSETVKEMNKRNSRSQSSSLGNERHIVCFLNTCRRKHRKTSSSGCHYILMITKNTKTMRR